MVFAERRDPRRQRRQIVEQGWTAMAGKAVQRLGEESSVVAMLCGERVDQHSRAISR